MKFATFATEIFVMPLYLNKQVSEDTVLAIWKITEHRDELSTFIGIDFFELEQRKENLHWLASRALISTIFRNLKIELTKDAFNKPSLKIDGKDYHISITHSFQFAAIIVSKNKTVGIDIEKQDERIQRVKHKFMREDEMYFLTKEDESNMLITIWSAKETLYKFYSKKELDFKINLCIEPFVFKPKFELSGSIIKENKKETLKINVELIEGYILTYIS